jgi:hypothetical protein
MKFKGLETSLPILFSYEILAIQYKRKREPKEAIGDDLIKPLIPEVPSKYFGNYNYTFALLNMNAAVVEGIMRSILSEIVSEEMKRQIDTGIKSGRNERSSPENLLNKFFIEIDGQGGWERLKEQYSSYLGLKIDKEIQPKTKEAMSTLFLLRNILAHGTALMHPSQPLSDDMKDELMFKWQSRLNSARVYLRKEFGHQDIFDNLAEFSIPEHFFNGTKQFLSEILPRINHTPSRAKKSIETIQNYSFGSVNISV